MLGMCSGSLVRGPCVGTVGARMQQSLHSCREGWASGPQGSFGEVNLKVQWARVIRSGVQPL